MNQAIAVKGAIVKDGKVLALWKTEDECTQDGSSDPADLPGGRLEYGEDPTEGLCREIQEEAGLRVKVGPVIHAWNVMRPDGLQIVIILYRCFWAEGEVQLGPEHNRYEWVDTSSDRLPDWVAEGVRLALQQNHGT
ncbi:MAG: NUDIX domain-containing protein [Symbiobacteriia bacterium]